MTNDEIIARLKRVYAALDASMDINVNSAKPIVEITDTRISVTQDFSDGLTQFQMENIAHSLIHNIANLKDHAKRQLARLNQDKSTVERFVSSVSDVAIIQDLSNNDKHGYPPRDGGISTRSPKLVNVRRVLQLRVGSGASAGISIQPSSEQTVWGSDPSALVVTGDVVDGKGAPVGDLHAIQSRAVEAWEHQLALIRL